jgi:hypothetical protein
MQLRQVNVPYDGSGLVVLPKQTGRFKVRSILLHFLSSPTDPSNANIRFVYGGVARVWSAFTGDNPAMSYMQACAYEGATFENVHNTNWGFYDQYVAVPLPKDFVLDSNWNVEIEFNSWNPANLPDVVDETSFYLEDIPDLIQMDLVALSKRS